MERGSYDDGWPAGRCEADHLGYGKGALVPFKNPIRGANHVAKDINRRYRPTGSHSTRQIQIIYKRARKSLVSKLWMGRRREGQDL